MFTTFSVPRTWGAAALAGLMTLAMLGSAQAAPDDDAVDPPSRVARLSYLGGEVSFQPAGDKDWVQASLNRPLVTGDSLYTDRNARTELQMGGAAVRLDDRSSINVLNLNDQIAQFELSEGVLRLSVRNLGRDQSYEIDTPTLAFVTTMPGEYRIDVAPDGRSTMVTVFDGSGDVYGEQNASYSVRAGNTYRFNDS
ncbi:MAG: FecR domain-containing protein, partial [Dokdonella sp.]|nr:FecR domain-containing protein [Dokdonella sp.]